KPAPAVGWALGVERVLELIKESGNSIPALTPDAYAVIPDAACLPVVMPVLQRLRESGVSIQMHAGATVDGMGSMKSQFKKADASGARFALIFGETELAQGCVAVKPLRGDKTDTAVAQALQPLVDVPLWAHTLRLQA
ncbi:MAG: His/Gly/Thr/Pro-type tRNA ligase C-terminal domain-containing protein, partial [Pseudomonadota bacterium]